MQFWAMSEDAGVSGFVVSCTKLDATLNAGGVIDSFRLIEAKQVLNAMLGGQEGYDGEIFYGREELGLLQWQAQIIMTTGDAARSDWDEDRADSALKALGIRTESGQLDFDVLRAFGDYTRLEWGVGAPDHGAARAHLAKLFPERVTARSPQ